MLIQEAGRSSSPTNRLLRKYQVAGRMALISDCRE